jgi:uridine kinase
MNRTLLLDQIADHVASLACPHPLRVAIDGIDAAGKTTFADGFVQPLETRGRPVIRASLDRFHYPRMVRYRRGSNSPEGYLYDSFDYHALKTNLLEPLGPGGSLEIRTSVFDFRTDSSAALSTCKAPSDAILLFDGVFLLREELDGCWDVSVFLDVDFDVALERAVRRDRAYFGSVEKVCDRYRKRYFPGQRLYLQARQPRARADFVIDNNDPMNPVIAMWRMPGR